MQTYIIKDQKDLDKFKDNYGYKIDGNAVFEYSAIFEERLLVDGYIKANGYIKAATIVIHIIGILLSVFYLFVAYKLAKIFVDKEIARFVY